MRTRRTKKVEVKKKVPYVKFKLDTDYNNKGAIQTDVYLVKIKVDPDTKKEKRCPEKVPVTTPTDLEEYMPWNSTARFIVQANKVWAAKTKSADGNRSWGITFKIIQMEVEPGTSKTSIKNEFKGYAFPDVSDDEDDEDADSKKLSSKKLSSKKEEDEDDDEDEEEDMEESEEQESVEADEEQASVAGEDTEESESLHEEDATPSPKKARTE